MSGSELVTLIGAEPAEVEQSSYVDEIPNAKLCMCGLSSPPLVHLPLLIWTEALAFHSQIKIP